MSTSFPSTGLSVTLNNLQNVYLPGQIVQGIVSWNLSDPPKKIVVNLQWKTQGKGMSDSQIISSIESPDHPPLSDTLPFSFQLPLEPYSFSGQLIAIIWSIEAKIPKTSLVETHEITVSPTGAEIRPQAPPVSSSAETG